MIACIGQRGRQSIPRSLTCRWGLYVGVATLALCLHAPAAAESRTDAGKRPIILLTGFEPFGPGKPANSSWEGIKELDGLDWKGFRIVARQLRVVWGEPLAQLEKLIVEHRPIAIFSFGQGGADAFALETKASNKRGKHADNLGELPASPTIVEDGPEMFQATLPAEKLASMLAEKGYPIRTSSAAGRYLCEEALYTLEYLKHTKKVEGTVAFCHVPPLKAKLKDRVVTADYVQQFVRDMLEAWHSVCVAKTTSSGEEASAVGKADEAKEAEKKAIEKFIHHYFRSWSDQDMKAYEALFHPESSIQHIDTRNRLTLLNRRDFIQSQRDYHRMARHKTTEVAERMEIRTEEKLVRVVVFWKLTAGPRTDYGYDHFTLMRDGDGLRIVNLVFYSTPAPEEK